MSSGRRRRLEARNDDPLKTWKLSPIDHNSLEHWDGYTEAAAAMLAATTPEHGVGGRQLQRQAKEVAVLADPDIVARPAEIGWLSGRSGRGWCSGRRRRRRCP